MLRIRLSRFAVFLIPFFVSCLSPGIAIDRRIVPADRFDIERQEDGTSIMHSFSVDASIKAVTPEDWDHISAARAYQPDQGSDIGQPSCLLFYYAVKNRSKLTIGDFTVDISWNGKTVPALSPDEFRKRFLARTDPLAPDLLRFRRLLTNTLSLKDIDIDRDTIGYPFGFVLPEDTVTGFASFYELPPEARTFQVKIGFTDGGVKKSVAFDMRREEYRQDMPEKRR
jgi:hypothetical protein